MMDSMWWPLRRVGGDSSCLENYVMACEREGGRGEVETETETETAHTKFGRMSSGNH